MTTPSKRDPVRAAIVGCGIISHAHGRAATALSDRVRIVACADIARAHAEKFAADHGVPAAYSDAREMLEKERPDLVIVATWPTLHEEHVLLAVGEGVPYVLCEKSLAMSAASAARMESAAREAGALVVEGMMFRHHPRILEAIRLAASGKIGTVRGLRAGFTRFADRSKEPAYKRNPSLGGGVPFDFTCYAVNALGAFCAELPAQVFGYWKCTETGLVEELNGVMIYPDGTTAAVESSFLRSYRQPLEIHGTEGVLCLEDAWTPGDAPEIEFRDLRRPGVPVMLSGGSAHGHTAQLEHLCDVIRDRIAPRLPISESVRNLAVLEALLASAACGQPVVPKLP